MHTGRCLCGAVRYRASGDPIWTGFCHCESCRRATGGATTAYAGFPDGKFRFEGMPPTEYRSSNGVIRTFCPVCGSSLAYRSARWPGETHILLGTADRPEEFKPSFHCNTKEQMPWLHFADGLPCFQTVASDTPPASGAT